MSRFFDILADDELEVLAEERRCQRHNARHGRSRMTKREVRDLTDEIGLIGQELSARKELAALQARRVRAHHVN